MNSSKSENPEKLNGKSADVLGERAGFFHKHFPEALTEGRVDGEKLKQALGEDGVAEGERYNFTWAGKSNVFDSISRQTTRTLRPDEAESVNFEDSENIFIEGENLEVLKILQKSYYGKVKMIYIDPPYNTGNDFVYRDNFRQTQQEEAEAAENVDEDGNLKSSGLYKNTQTGRYHSNWLNMMYPRLFLARNLLRDDGVIFISIDDNEVHNLRMMMNEIFGEENFVAQFVHKNNSIKNQANLVSISTEYVLCFAKNYESLKQNIWRTEKKGARDIAKLFERLKENGMILDEIEGEVKEMYKRPKYSHLSRWNKVDENGVFKDADLSREGGPTDYTIKNPETGEDCVIPSRGWGKSEEELIRLQEEDMIWYGNPETPPGMKDYIEKGSESVPDNF